MTKTVTVILRNADFTEGRGPMMLHAIYDNLEAARTYIRSQKGIYRSPQYAEPKVYGNTESWNGFNIILNFPVLSEYDPAYVKALERQKEEIEDKLKAVTALLNSYGSY